MAIENPEKFVLKPQREGGGNNLYGEEIKATLCPIRSSVERTAFILMDQIHPKPYKNYIIRPDKQLEVDNVISELGIYGIVIGYG